MPVPQSVWATAGLDVVCCDPKRLQGLLALVFGPNRQLVSWRRRVLGFRLIKTAPRFQALIGTMEFGLGPESPNHGWSTLKLALLRIFDYKHQFNRSMALFMVPGPKARLSGPIRRGRKRFGQAEVRHRTLGLRCLSRRSGVEVHHPMVAWPSLLGFLGGGGCDF